MANGDYLSVFQLFFSLRHLAWLSSSFLAAGHFSAFPLFKKKKNAFLSLDFRVATLSKYVSGEYRLLPNFICGEIALGKISALKICCAAAVAIGY